MSDTFIPTDRDHFKVITYHPVNQTAINNGFVYSRQWEAREFYSP